MTDAAGSFQYREGEAVTFSVGGTKLGTATGAATLSIFDLMGATPMTDGVMVVQRLEEPSSATRPFFRAVNAWTFLVGLDADANPTNGIDLTGREEQLANVHVGFDHTPADFEAQLRIAARVPNYALRAAGLDATFATLYSAHGLTVSGDAVSEASLSVAGMSLTYTFVYDANSQAVSVVGISNGVIGANATVVHDAGLRLLSSTYNASPDGAGGFESQGIAAFDYSPAGQYLGATQTRKEGAAAPTVDESTTLTYDGSRRLTSFVQRATTVSSSTFAYDESADAVTVLYEFRLAEDEPVSSRSRTRFGYDADGNVVSQIYANDSPATGVYTSTSTTTATFDARGYVLTRVSSSVDAAGAPTGRSEETFTYDGTYLTEDRYVSQGADGAVTYTSTTTYQYAGDLLTRRTSTSQRPGGPATVSSDDAITYDGNGHILVKDSKYFDDGGALTGNDIETFTYDERGNVATQVRTSLGGGGMSPVTSYTYAPIGNPIVAALQRTGVLNGGL